LRDSIFLIFALIFPLSVVALIRFAIAFALAFAFAFVLAFALEFAFAFFEVFRFGEFGRMFKSFGGLGVKRTLYRILFEGGAFNEGLG
jgi:hypothetical protein